jgi:cytochrome c-type biogenesis protein
MVENVTLGLAFLAGLVSFVSPCVLPLVPAYIGYMGGRITHRVAAQVMVGTGNVTTNSSLSNRFNTVIHGMAFVIGFTFVFVVIGIVTTVFFSVISGGDVTQTRNIIGRVGGIVIIIFGLHFMGVLPAIFSRLRQRQAVLDNASTTLMVAAAGSALILWAFWLDVSGATYSIDGTYTFTGREMLVALPLVAIWLLWLFLGGALTEPARFWTGLLDKIEYGLYSDTRRQMMANPQQGLGGSALMGVVFAAGWTPCIGPIYGSVLTLATNTGNIAQATPLLIAYSLGLGIPFILTAALLDGAQGILRRLQRHVHRIEIVAGAFLVFIGVLVATGRLQELSQNFAAQFADVSVRVENCIVGWAQGNVYFNQIGTCLGGRLFPIEIEVAGRGKIDGVNGKMEYVFGGQKGQKIDILVENPPVISSTEEAATPLASLESLTLTLYDPIGTRIASSDSNEFLQNDEGALLPIVNVSLPSDGVYLVVVTSSAAQVDFMLSVIPSSEAAIPNQSVESVGNITELASSGDPVVGLDIGNLAPDFTTSLDSGESITLSSLRGKVILLNFWATWCAPCRIEMPEFEKAFQEKGGDGFTILAVNNRENLEDVTGFRDEVAVTFPFLLDEQGKIQDQFTIVSYPSTYIINREGIIVARHFGPLTAAQIQELIDKAMAT